MSTVMIGIAEASRKLSQLINQAAYGKDIVILTSRETPKAVMLGIEAFQELIGVREYAQRGLMPLNDFQRQFRQVLEDAGYETTDQIVDLVRNVKHEMVEERG